VPRTASAIEIRRARGAAELEAALALRRAVFCDEQGVPSALEVDGRDGEAIHLVAVEGGRVVGTCRLRTGDSTLKLERLAVARDARRRGVGGALVVAAEAHAADAARVVLTAQTRAVGLYAARGFVTVGEPFEQAGIEHVRMEKRLA
jgi:predicted GNAT family N-acyltransferase